MRTSSDIVYAQNVAIAGLRHLAALHNPTCMLPSCVRCLKLASESPTGTFSCLGSTLVMAPLTTLFCWLTVSLVFGPCSRTYANLVFSIHAWRKRHCGIHRNAAPDNASVVCALSFDTTASCLLSTIPSDAVPPFPESAADAATTMHACSCRDGQRRFHRSTNFEMTTLLHVGHTSTCTHPSVLRLPGRMLPLLQIVNPCRPVGFVAAAGGHPDWHVHACTHVPRVRSSVGRGGHVRGCCAALECYSLTLDYYVIV